MLFRGLSVAALMMAASAASASQSAIGNAENASRPAGSYQVAQACGWYAISVCSRNRSGANRAANAYGGYVIDSSSEAYPNFRPGWYCAVEGPTSKGKANRRKREMRQDGAGSAYIKNGC